VSELTRALTAGVNINADNFQELTRIDTIVKTLPNGTTSTIGCRINPQISGGSVQATATIAPTSKFGIALESKDKLLECFRNYPWLTSLHCHVGSQGCPAELLVDGAVVCYNLAVEVNELLGEQRIKVIDLGGGMPVDYGSDDPAKSDINPAKYCEALAKKLPGLFQTDPTFKVVTEYGRYVSAKAACIVSNVEYTKSAGGREIAVIHAGADLFIRTCYTDNFPHRISTWNEAGEFVVAPEKGAADAQTWDVVGPLCFRGDIVGKEITLTNKLCPGWFCMIHDTGAYTLSMVSRYNSRQVPPVYGWSKEGGIELLIPGETREQTLKVWGVERKK